MLSSFIAATAGATKVAGGKALATGAATKLATGAATKLATGAATKLATGAATKLATGATGKIIAGKAGVALASLTIATPIAAVGLGYLAYQFVYGISEQIAVAAIVTAKELQTKNLQKINQKQIQEQNKVLVKVQKVNCSPPSSPPSPSPPSNSSSTPPIDNNSGKYILRASLGASLLYILMRGYRILLNTFRRIREIASQLTYNGLNYLPLLSAPLILGAAYNRVRSNPIRMRNFIIGGYLCTVSSFCTYALYRTVCQFYIKPVIAKYIILPNTNTTKINDEKELTKK